MNIKEAWLSSGLISEVQAGKKNVQHLREQNSLSSSVQLLLSFVFNNMVFAHSQTAVCKSVRIQG